MVVLEKGGLYDTGDFAGFSEMDGYKNLYEKQVRALLLLMMMMMMMMMMMLYLVHVLPARFRRAPSLRRVSGLALARESLLAQGEPAYFQSVAYYQ